MRARHRVSKLLLRHGIIYSGGDPWTGKHDAWLRSQRFDRPGVQIAFDSSHEAMLLTLDRRDRLDAAIEQMASDSEFTPVVQRLACLRGISTLTAFGLAVEIGDWHRFTGSSIGAYVGLVPTENSSGDSRSQGSITKTGKRPRPSAAGRGGLAPPQDLPHPRKDHASPAGNTHPSPHESADMRATGASTTAGKCSTSARRSPSSPTSPSPASSPAGAGRWPPSTIPKEQPKTVRPGQAGSQREERLVS
jgi:transposase